VTECSIPINVLEAAPFSLSQGDSVYAKVLAYNSIGEGQFSIAGNGAIISTIVVPDAPQNLLRDPVATTTSQVGLTWDDGAYDGGSAVIDYRVSFDIGDGSFIVI
jgi:hypothetical protein